MTDEDNKYATETVEDILGEVNEDTSWLFCPREVRGADDGDACFRCPTKKMHGGLEKCPFHFLADRIEDALARERARVAAALATVANVAAEMRGDWEACGVAPSILADGWATVLDAAAAECTKQFLPHGAVGKQER